MKQEFTYGKTNDVLHQLAQKLAKGDAEALEEIYRMYFHRLYYYGIQIIGKEQHEEVEDVIQDFFIWLAQNHRKIEKVRDFEVYLFQSIRRNVQSRQQKAKNKRESFEKYVNRTLPLQEISEHSPEALQISKEKKQEQKNLIQAELKKLPAYQREILYLRYFEDKSYKEIAEILSISDQVAYNYVSRAIKNLKKHLANFTLLFLLLFSLS